MNQRPPLANILTLGASDSAGERNFYVRIGWPLVLDTDSIWASAASGPPTVRSSSTSTVSCCPRCSIMPLTWPVISLVRWRAEPTGCISVALAASSRARRAGTLATKEPLTPEFFNGQDAYFADAEGNFREVAWSADEIPVTAAARRTARE